MDVEKIVNVPWKEKRTDESIPSELDLKRELLGKIMTLKLGYFGHIMRDSVAHSQSRLLKE